jgi:hypothetical protein
MYPKSLHTEGKECKIRWGSYLIVFQTQPYLQSYPALPAINSIRESIGIGSQLLIYSFMHAKQLDPQSSGHTPSAVPQRTFSAPFAPSPSP